MSLSASSTPFVPAGRGWEDISLTTNLHQSNCRTLKDSGDLNPASEQFIPARIPCLTKSSGKEASNLPGSSNADQSGSNDQESCQVDAHVSDFLSLEEWTDGDLLSYYHLYWEGTVADFATRYKLSLQLVSLFAQGASSTSSRIRIALRSWIRSSCTWADSFLTASPLQPVKSSVGERRASDHRVRRILFVDGAYRRNLLSHIRKLYNNNPALFSDVYICIFVRRKYKKTFITSLTDIRMVCSVFMAGSQARDSVDHLISLRASSLDFRLAKHIHFGIASRLRGFAAELMSYFAITERPTTLVSSQEVFEDWLGLTAASGPFRPTEWKEGSRPSLRNWGPPLLAPAVLSSYSPKLVRCALRGTEERYLGEKNLS